MIAAVALFAVAAGGAAFDRPPSSRRTSVPFVPAPSRADHTRRQQHHARALARWPRRRVRLGSHRQHGDLRRRHRARQRRSGDHQRRRPEHAAGLVARRPLDRVSLAAARRHLDCPVDRRRAAAGRRAGIERRVVARQRTSRLHPGRRRHGRTAGALDGAARWHRPPTTDAARAASRRAQPSRVVAERALHRLRGVERRGQQRDLDRGRRRRRRRGC